MAQVGAEKGATLEAAAAPPTLAHVDQEMVNRVRKFVGDSLHHRKSYITREIKVWNI